jgi:hypothetical protein
MVYKPRLCQTLEIFLPEGIFYPKRYFIRHYP